MTPDPTIPDLIATLRSKLAAATPRPWEAIEIAGFWDIQQSPAAYDRNDVLHDDEPRKVQNAELICSAVNAAIPLCDEIERLTAERQCMLALMELMARDEAFVHHGEPFLRDPLRKKADAPSLDDFGFDVLCSDTFAWACADGESIALNEAPEILRLHNGGGWAAVARWVQEKRGGKDKSPFIKPVDEKARESERLHAERDALRAKLDRLVAAAGEADELIDDLRSYCRESWDWKYGEMWDEHVAKWRAAVEENKP